MPRVEVEWWGSGESETARDSVRIWVLRMFEDDLNCIHRAFLI